MVFYPKLHIFTYIHPYASQINLTPKYKAPSIKSYTQGAGVCTEIRWSEAMAYAISLRGYE